MPKHDKEGNKKSSSRAASHQQGDSGKPKGEKNAEQAGTMERVREKVADTTSEAMASARSVLESEPVRATVDKGSAALTEAGEMLADAGRNAMDAGRNLASSLMDASVLLGLAAGLGVWWFMHDAGDTNAGDVEIKSGGTVARVQDSAGQLVGSLSESASSISSGAVQKMQGVLTEVQGAVERSPWVFVAGGLLVGGLLAVLMPQTESENRLLGQVRDQVVDQAQETLQTTVKDTLQAGAMQTAVEVVKGSLG